MVYGEINEYNDLEIERMYLRQFERVRHLKVPDEPYYFLTPEEILKREYEKATGIKELTKEEAETLVCDGAILNCSHSKVVGLSINSKNKYEKVSARSMLSDIFAITLKVPDYMAGTFLMGKDGAATNFCVHDVNFEVHPKLECANGGMCELKRMANEWTDVSSILMNGFNALKKESVLTCKKCAEARITIEDNGQDSEIKNAEWEKFLVSIHLTPNVRQKIGEVFASVQIIGGTAKVVGGLILLPTGGGAWLIVVGTFELANGTRDMKLLHGEEDPLVNKLSTIGISRKDAEKLADVNDIIRIPKNNTLKFPS